MKVPAINKTKFKNTNENKIIYVIIIVISFHNIIMHSHNFNKMEKK